MTENRKNLISGIYNQDSMDSRELGRQGEELACRFLRRKGYRIMERNYRSPLGEIDIIGRDKGTIAFVEVKTRRSMEYGYPQDSVTRSKQHQIRKAALTYLKKNGVEVDCRFDVVSVLISPDNKTSNIELIKDAF